MNTIIKIAITGGPCAGKTSSMRCIKDCLEKKGYLVFILQEPATELLYSGATYDVCNGAVEFQTNVLLLHIARERLYENIANKVQSSNSTVVLICDRGAVDCLAYLSSEEKEQFLKLNGQSYDALLARYNAVFHMYSVTSTLPELYSSESNFLRFESAEEAALLDANLEELWSNHSYYKKIFATTVFEEKLSKLTFEIENYLCTLG